MKLLTDIDIHQRVTSGIPIVNNLPLPPGGDWFAVGSAIQPSSIDLHIGKIFLPEKEGDELGSHANPLSEYILKAGGTAVITTQESFSLPSNLAGIGFPPDSVSSQGLLMTNPGHIDPGYVGTLRFTLINMGRKPYCLRGGDSIVTVLLFELGSSVKKDYNARHTGQMTGVPKINDTLGRLSADFINMEKRAVKVAAKEVRKAALWAGLVPTVVSGVIALITALVVGQFTWKEQIQEIKSDIAILNSKPDPSQLRTDISVLQSKADPNELRNQIEQLQEQISEMRRSLPAGGSGQNNASGKSP